jgi:DNA-binding NarL/FixJ family response regulator
VILSFPSSNAFIAHALNNGAVGYVVKGSPEQDLIRAVREASARGRVRRKNLAAEVDVSGRWTFLTISILLLRRAVRQERAAGGKQ